MAASTPETPTSLAYITLFDLSNSNFSGIPKENVQVIFDNKFDRLSNDCIETKIDKIWNEKCQHNPHMFNGLKFRLQSLSKMVDSNIRTEESSLNIHMELGLTNYRDYIGTHYCNLEKEEKEEKEDCNDHITSVRHRSCALGCEAVLTTSDDCIVLLRRTVDVATHSGLYNGPSGHPEPDHIIDALPSMNNQQSTRHSEKDDEYAISSSNEINNNDISQEWSRFKYCKQDNIIEELFSSVVEEIKSETGIDSKVKGYS